MYIGVYFPEDGTVMYWPKRSEAMIVKHITEFPEFIYFTV